MIKISDIKQKWNFLKSKNIFVACSGGVDSIVTAFLLTTISKNITLIHINYNLRGNDSIRDEKIVSEFALKHNLKLISKSYNTQQIINETNGNLQLIARKIRYEIFNEIREKSAENIVILGHHLDDQIETFYLNLVRKSGLLGLTAMHAYKDQFARPLLPYSKDEIYTFAKKNDLTWGEDYSNQESKYSRNKFRNIILPELYSEIPSLKESIQCFIEKLQEQRQKLEHFVTSKINTKEKNIYSILTIDFQKFNENQLAILFHHLSIRTKFLNRINEIKNGEVGKMWQIDHWNIYKERREIVFEKNIESLTLPNLKTEDVKQLPETFSKNEIYLDKDLIKGEIRLRFWQQKDRMNIIGTKGSKLISDILKDDKVPNYCRKKTIVVTLNDEIIWCVNHRVSPKYIANKSSNNILKISI